MFSDSWRALPEGRTLGGERQVATEDARLERQALERLADLDVDGCRRTLLRLGRRISTAPSGGDGAAAALLLDVLHRVNRRLFPADEAHPDYRAGRLTLIRRFEGCREPDDAARRFRAEVNRLLAEVSATRPPLADRARRYIDENYHRRISLSSIADALNVSSSHLSRSFSRATSRTVTAYVHGVRIAHARVLLAEGSRSISEIAYRVGYQTYRDFYRNFVRIEGRAPSAARRLLSEGRGGAARGRSRARS